MAEGIIFSIEEFALNDGPGIRTTVFLKGCPLRCVWCHNPEGWKREPEILVKQGREENCGRVITSQALALRLKRDEKLFQESGGGVTFTGGEPLMQAAFLAETANLLPNIHKAVETSGYGSPDVFRKVLNCIDFMLFDIKVMDPALHMRYTGVDNSAILSNLEVLISSEKPFVARIPLIPGINDSIGNMEATAAFLAGAKGLQRVELLRYNHLAGAKYPMLGMRYSPPFDESKEPEIHDVFTDKGIKLIIL